VKNDVFVDNVTSELNSFPQGTDVMYTTTRYTFFASSANLGKRYGIFIRQSK